MLENGLDKCTCSKLKCVRHGKCSECMAYHMKKDNLPRCKREKKKAFFGKTNVINRDK